MRITFKLYATLQEYLPEDAVKNSISIDVPEDISAYQVIDQFKVPREKAHLVLVNGVYIYPDQRNEPILKENDTLAVWPPVAGG